jgi:hypothetical protein
MRLECDIAKLDLRNLVRATAKGRKTQFEPQRFGPLEEFVILGEEEAMFSPETSRRRRRDVVRELTKEGLAVFLPFCGPNVEGQAVGADGEQYRGGYDEAVDGCVMRLKGDRFGFKAPVSSWERACRPPRRKSSWRPYRVEHGRGSKRSSAHTTPGRGPDLSARS